MPQAATRAAAPARICAGVNPASPTPPRGFRRPAPLLLAGLGAVLLVFLTQHNGFFWDGILLVSRYGQFYYDTGFHTFFVPDDIAVSYPGTLAWGVALGWRAFGKTLEVSQWLMLPWLLLLIWQAWLLVRRFVPAAHAGIGLALLLLDPTLLGQAALVAHDILLVALFLTALNAQLHHRRGVLALALVGLTLLHLRGTFLVGALGLLEGLSWWLLDRHGADSPPGTAFSAPERLGAALRRLLPAYVPVGLVTVGWLLLFQARYGWVFYRATGPWAVHTADLGALGVARNIGLVGWRLLDLGRIALWATTLSVVFRIWRRRQWTTTSTRLTLFVLVPLGVLMASMVRFPVDIGHRYYLPVFLLTALWVAHHVTQLATPPVRRRVLGLCLISLLSGHFWVYPDGIAKGWDASLAHLPYFRLRREMLTELARRRIPLAAVGSDYPNAYPLRFPDLGTDNRAFAPLDLPQNQYVLESNVMNGFTNAQLAELRNPARWRLLHEARSAQVYLRLYERW